MGAVGQVGEDQLPRVLLIDDEIAVATAMSRGLSRSGFTVTVINHPAEGLAYLAAHADDIDVVVLDVDMPGLSGFQVLAQIKQHDYACPVVMWTADETAMSATQAMHAGAFTYVTKPVANLDAFLSTLHSATNFGRLRRHARALENRLHARVPRLGESAVMQRVRERLLKLAASDVTVVVIGESGTGKELVARAIHDASARAGKPFVALNCGAIAETMIDSELFGHIRGSFTGATGNRPGLFVEADQGTIFLDEVAELPLGAQARLLRVLQEREVRPVGSDTPRKIDVRVVAATHVDLVAAVQAKRFREDLYHRLNVSSIQVPPLRERLSDIPLLVVTLLAKHAGQRRVHLTPAALTALSHYAYPGNVRELENALLHALALTAGDALDATTLPDAITNAVGKPRPAAHVEGVSWSDGLSLVEARKKATDDFERRYVLTLLGKTSGNLTQAARIAGLDRANFRRVMARLGIDAAQFREL